MNKSIMPLIFFVVALIVAIMLGDFVIARMFHMNPTEAPKILRVMIHGFSLGLVFYAGVKFFAKK